MNHPSTLVIDLAELTAADLHRAGGKAFALGRLADSGTPDKKTTGNRYIAIPRLTTLSLSLESKRYILDNKKPRDRH